MLVPVLNIRKTGGASEIGPGADERFKASQAEVVEANNGIVGINQGAEFTSDGGVANYRQPATPEARQQVFAELRISLRKQFLLVTSVPGGCLGARRRRAFGYPGYFFKSGQYFAGFLICRIHRSGACGASPGQTVSSFFKVAAGQSGVDGSAVGIGLQRFIKIGPGSIKFLQKQEQPATMGQYFRVAGREVNRPVQQLQCA